MFPEDVKNEGFSVQVVQRITELEDFKRKHETVPHPAGDPSSVGWIFDANTWTFVSQDGPISVISINADMTGVLTLGYRVRLVHNGSTKYFLIHAIGAYSGGVTLVTLYGGTLYTLSALAITSTYYSPSKIPFGFPALPSNWTVTVTNTTNATQAPPVTNTWYNLGSIQISVPIGSWECTYFMEMEEVVTTVAVGNRNFRATLSTANNAESDNAMTRNFIVPTPIGAALQIRFPFNMERKVLTVAAKTTYFLNAIFNAAVASTSISFRGDVIPTRIDLVSAYL